MPLHFSENCGKLDASPGGSGTTHNEASHGGKSPLMPSFLYLKLYTNTFSCRFSFWRKELL